MSNSSLITSIISTYNRKNYVCDAIDSVLNQTYPNVELIVIDDGSTDGTGELLQEKYGNRIRYIYQENQGRSEARNHGMRIAKGDYITFLDSDDVWKPNKLATQIAFMQRHAEYGLTHTFSQVVRGDDSELDEAQTARRLKAYSRAIDRGYNYEHMTHLCLMFLSTVMVRAEVLQHAGLFDKQTETFEDWDWYLRFALITKIGTIQETLTDYRIHDGNSTQAEFQAGRQRVAHKHLTLVEQINLPADVKRRVRHNLYLHLAVVAYNNKDGKTCTKWVRRAAALDPWAIVMPKNLRYALTAVLPQSFMLGVRRLRREVTRRSEN